MGVMAVNADAVSRQLRPAILPLSSMRKMVSNWVRNAYGESSVNCIGPGTTAELAGGEYAGGAESLRGFGRRVGVPLANGFVVNASLILLFVEGTKDGVVLDGGM